MAKFNSPEWDEVRKKFRHSIMADTSLVSLAQNLDTKEWPHAGEEEKPSKYIEFMYDELLMLPEIAGSEDRADHLIGILKETLAFDDPFGDMVAQVEETASKENPIIKTLGRLNIPENYPLTLANFSEATRVVLGGDVRNALNALTHGDEEGIGAFLPYRKGSTGLHLAEAIALIPAGLPRPDQLGLAKAYGARLTTADSAAARTLTKDQVEKMEGMLRVTTTAALDWFKADKEALLKLLADGGSYERYFVVANDQAREAIAVKLTSGLLKDLVKASPAAAAESDDKKGGFFSKFFGKR